MGHDHEWGGKPPRDAPSALPPEAHQPSKVSGYDDALDTLGDTGNGTLVSITTAFTSHEQARPTFTGSSRFTSRTDMGIIKSPCREFTPWVSFGKKI